MNQKNILVNDWFISLIDCDGFHVQGESRTYGSRTFRPRFTPPEGLGDTIEEVRLCDRFGLGIHIFQILMEGFHPFHGQGPGTTGGSCDDWIRNHPFPYENPIPGHIEPYDQAPPYDEIHADLQELFAKCFVDAKANPKKRPSPLEWAKTLHELEIGDELLQSEQKENLWEGWKSVGQPHETEQPDEEELQWDDWEIEDDQDMSENTDEMWNDWDIENSG